MNYLQRHGESVNNLTKMFTCRRLDPGLTELGRKQIKDRVPYYNTKGINCIYSSPSRRAVESAEILSSRLGIEFFTDYRLLEVDVGSMEGKSEQAPHLLAKFYSTVNDWLVGNRNTRFRGGESFGEVQDRLRSIKSLTFQGPSILIGHSTLFAVFLGMKGVCFTKVEELFLPRGGLATYDPDSGRCEIEAKVQSEREPHA